MWHARVPSIDAITWDSSTVDNREHRRKREQDSHPLIQSSRDPQKSKNSLSFLLLASGGPLDDGWTNQIHSLELYLEKDVRFSSASSQHRVIPISYPWQAHWNITIADLFYCRPADGCIKGTCTVIQNKQAYNVRVERAWVETPGGWIVFFVTGPLFTPYQEFSPNFECLCWILRPRKAPKTRYYDLKWRNNAITE